MLFILLAGNHVSAGSVLSVDLDMIAIEYSELGRDQYVKNLYADCGLDESDNLVTALLPDTCHSDGAVVWRWVFYRALEPGTGDSVQEALASTQRIKDALQAYQRKIEDVPSLAFDYADLPRLSEIDQHWELVILDRAGIEVEQGLSADEKWSLSNLAYAVKQSVYRKNQRQLSLLMERHGWPSASVYGHEVSSAAWLIVQHTDFDPAFQKHALTLMEPLLDTGEIERSHYAYLYDRVALNTEGYTLYGTQVHCVSGRYQPKNLKHPESVDERRAAFELEPLHDYLEDILAFSNGSCGPG